VVRLVGRYERSQNCYTIGMNQDAIMQYAKQNPSRDVAVLGLRDLAGNVLLMRTHKLPESW
jgi:hypothetical protein